MRVDKRSSTHSLEALCGRSQCTDLGSSDSTLEFNEHQQSVRVVRLQKPGSFRLLPGKVAKALNMGGSVEEDQPHLQEQTLTRNETSKPVRVRLVLKKDKGAQPPHTQSLLRSKSDRKIVGRRKSFFGMTGCLNDSTLLDTDDRLTPKQRSMTPTRRIRDAGKEKEKAPVTPRKAACRSSSICSPLAPTKRIPTLSPSGSDRRGLQNNCCSLQHNTSVLRRVTSRDVSAEYLKNSIRNLTMQEFLDEYDKIAGEEVETR